MSAPEASINDGLNAIQRSPLAHLVSKSNHMVAASLQILHVLGFILLLAALFLIGLRVAGVILRRQPLQEVTRDASRLVWLGLAMGGASGLLMFIASPRLYFFNPAFDAKMALLLLAIVIQCVLFRAAVRSAAARPGLARITVALSLAAWLSIAVAGRLIGFV
jgi:hypothetical protein